MKSWEIVLIVLGAAVGMLCVIFIFKQMGACDGREEELPAMKEAVAYTDADIKKAREEIEAKMAESSEEDPMMEEF